MRHKLITGLGALAAATALTLGLGGTALADTTGTGSLNVTYDLNIGFTHLDSVSYTCGVDGVVSFTGTGSVPDYNVTETVDGQLNTVSNTWSLHGVYDQGGYVYDANGTIASTATPGTSNLTVLPGTYVYDGTGQFTGVPNCVPSPVAGNHGQYVSGAAKAGVKGVQLAAIAKDGSLVGPYPG